MMAALLKPLPRTLALLVFAVSLCGCFAAAQGMGTPLPKQTRFSIQWRNYGRLAPNKSIAVAGDINAVFVSGYAFGYSDEQGAVNAALAQCESRRADRRIAAPCLTYAIGDRTLAAPDSETAALE